ncbi:hypothetical protein Ancab_013752 [Ancistrocladus abbreviatus]
MAKPPESNVTWGTLEELLLASAVNRYGTNCWDSVAKEIQKRTSTFHLLTPQNCRQKYHDLKRRFTTQSDGGATHAPPIDAEDADADTSIWLDELRRLRIAELKRDLQRYDVSIVSLQLKVKKLKEEREQSLKENQREESDLEEKNQERDREDEEKKGKENIPETFLPESGTDKGVSGGDSDRENQSVNESNSTDHKSGSLDDRLDGTKKERDIPVVCQPDPVKGTAKPDSEASYDGSSDTITAGKKSAGSQDRNSAKGESLKERVDSPEFIESVAESKGGGEDEGTKESSDVQSSASLSRKLGREKGIPSSNSGRGGDGPEAENQSPVVKSSNGKFQPLIDFLELIRSAKDGSMFEHRLETQETAEYKSIIRQHVDLDTIQTRLDEGHYSDCHAKFYRDLLVLVNNVAVYFARRSSEHKAAVELRQLIRKQLPHSKKGTAAPSSPPPTPYPPEPKPESEPVSDSLLLKPKLSGGPVVACRKRSSIVAKSSEGEKKRDTAVPSRNDEKEKIKEREKDKDKEKAVVDVKLREKSSFSAVTKKRTRDQRVIGSRNSSKNSGGNDNNSKSRVSNPPSNKNPDSTGTDISSELKSEKKNNSSNATTNVSNAKKQSAANFLKRMRRSSSSPNNGSLLDSLKNSTGSSGVSSKGAEGKKNGGGNGGGGSIIGGKSEARNDQNSLRKVSGSKQVKEKEKEERERGNAAARKNAGRPPKRVATLAAVGKRRRDGRGEVEALPKKRARK